MRRRSSQRQTPPSSATSSAGARVPRHLISDPITHQTQANAAFSFNARIFRHLDAVCGLAAPAPSPSAAAPEVATAAAAAPASAAAATTSGATPGECASGASLCE